MSIFKNTSNNHDEPAGDAKPDEEATTPEASSASE